MGCGFLAAIRFEALFGILIGLARLFVTGSRAIHHRL